MVSWDQNMKQRQKKSFYPLPWIRWQKHFLQGFLSYFKVLLILLQSIFEKKFFLKNVLILEKHKGTINQTVAIQCQVAVAWGAIFTYHWLPLTVVDLAWFLEFLGFMWRRHKSLSINWALPLNSGARCRLWPIQLATTQ